MDINQLKSMVILAEELHFTRASQRIGVSQSALSQQIQRMEEELGVTLFNRSQRKVKLTGPGELFLVEATALIRQFDQAVLLTQRLSSGQIGQIRVGFVENASFNVLPDAVSEFRKRYPDVNVVLLEMISTELVEALLKDKIDVALLRPIIKNEPLEISLVITEPYYVAIAETHLLARKSSVQVQDVASLPLIVATGQKSLYLKKQFRPYYNRLGFDLTIGQEANQLPTIMALVGAGMGYTLVPKSTTGLRVPNVVYVPLADREAPKAELAIASREGVRNPLVSKFRDTLVRTQLIRRDYK